jgi:hypothetical protein
MGKVLLIIKIVIGIGIKSHHSARQHRDDKHHFRIDKEAALETSLYH